MVRLFVPEGEGQHVLEPRYPDPAVANRQILQLPWRSTFGAISITAFLALVGKSKPGTFLRTTAYLSIADFSITTCQLYGEREVNRAVFKLDKVEPKPGKLWERTKHWTADDFVVGGGVLGTFLSLNPRALPGVSGWKRFLGAGIVGCAVGGYVGETRLARVSPQLLNMMNMAKDQNRALQYDRLNQDAKAKESLSRFGKIALGFYTWPLLGININPFASSSAPRAGGVAAGASQAPFEGNPHAGFSQQEMDQHTIIQIEFNKGELNGPDIENGYRGYKDTVEGRDENELQDYLERLREVKERTVTEAQYVWHHLAKKERDFYDLVDEDREKDIVRREIQLLNNMASDFSLRAAILQYHIADASKRLDQMKRKEAGGKDSLLPAKALQDEAPVDWKDRCSPELVADQMRITWSRQKELLGFLEQATTMHKDIQPGAGTPQEGHLKQIKQNAEQMKKNVEATERLLKEFEEQIQKAEEYTER